MDYTLPIPYPLFVERLAKPAVLILEGLTPLKTDVLHMTLGVSGEAAELCEPVRDWCLVGATPFDRVNFIEELSDLEFFLEHLRAILGIPRVSTLTKGSEGIAAYHPFTARFLDAAFVLVIASGDLVKASKDWALFGKAEDLCRAAIFQALLRIESALHELRNFQGITHEECLFFNEEKLMKRYKTLQFTDEACLARADKAAAP